MLRSLVPRYDGPFIVQNRVGVVAYRLTLLKQLKLHPVFHVSFLKKFHEDPDLERRPKTRAPPNIHAQFDRELDDIEDSRTRDSSSMNRRTVPHPVAWSNGTSRGEGGQFVAIQGSASELHGEEYGKGGI